MFVTNLVGLGRLCKNITNKQCVQLQLYYYCITGYVTISCDLISSRGANRFCKAALVDLAFFLRESNPTCKFILRIKPL